LIGAQFFLLQRPIYERPTMQDGDMLIVRGQEVASLLRGRESELVDIVREAYQAHAAGHSSLPQSLFLYFPENPGSRIIALPAFLGGKFDVAGVKWVASFPSNLSRGIDRASAVVVLNCPKTGRPEAMLEASTINAKRTAASAALAAALLHKGKPESTLALLGCGPINFEIARFVQTTVPQIKRLVVSDLDLRRAGTFREKCLRTFDGIEVGIARDVSELLASSSLIALATTAGSPHILDLTPVAAGSTILHVSLRDLAAEVILTCDNVVDDIDHVCRAQTSVHLAQQLTGNREFIRCTIADVASGLAPARRDPDGVVVFSPFGLGILDMAVARFVRDRALDRDLGTLINSFLAAPWSEAEDD
jgi:ornithine cyclodeaminase